MVWIKPQYFKDTAVFYTKYTMCALQS